MDSKRAELYVHSTATSCGRLATTNYLYSTQRHSTWVPGRMHAAAHEHTRCIIQPTTKKTQIAWVIG